MAPIEIASVNTSGRRVDAVILVTAGGQQIHAVFLKCQLNQAGAVDRFSGEHSEIRVHTREDHLLANGDRVDIEDSPAPEANGEWLIANVLPRSFVLRGSTFQGNISATGAVWSMRKSPFSQAATSGGGNSWQSSMLLTRPGNYHVFGQLLWTGSPSVVRTPGQAVSIS